ncbi:MAG: biopolymer transporter TolR [Pseudozobellia sp.]|nr:biopolymer transporter TolR [Pseudozobellia sp.]|tara:strand:+ start:39202 stop:40701 length:1500 start_codon:yes stop_codon:yes gene_type:complete
MKSTSIVFVLLLAFIANTHAQNDLGIFNLQSDIGDVKHQGTTTYDPETQTYQLTGSGANIWFDKDEFHFAHKKTTGNFILRTHAKFIGEGVDAHRKLGWMVRTDSATDAPMVCATVHGDGLTSIQYRKKKGEQIEEVIAPIKAPDVIQLERRGGSFFLSVAKYGDLFWSVEVPHFEFPEELLTGLFVCAHNADVKEKAEFKNTRIVLPAPAELVPYQEYLGSHLERMSIDTGNRKILYTVENSIQAPNWTPDGKTLIFNSEGLLFNYDLNSNKVSQLPTDFVKNNNNDHVLSFGGKMLGISSASGEEEYGSLVYTVPVAGGVPKRITPTGPSYLHGWSPDGKWLTYTGGRNGVYDIYKIASDGKGKEIKLTDQPTLDDGSEYTPDGKYIYFNSARTGSMEIWRMRPDGTEQEQLTNDSLQNWFPHISPDGKSMVFISYLPEVPAADHPFYKQVYLRTMTIDGGPIKVVAYLYGGQGTINVPSWSPDGKHIAFVSNTLID